MGLKIGITGGIGAGKSIICNIFKVLGVPVYNADQEAKNIMQKSKEVRSSLVTEFGEAVYTDKGELDRKFLAAQVFGSEERLKVLNGIVHPAVIKDAENWAEQQQFAYSLKEAALLFESGSYTKLDYTILVTAPEDVRIARVVDRDRITAEQVKERISKQMMDEEKIVLADFVIINDGVQALLPQVLALHTYFLTL
ncbi:dephospho-CoA kinase [Sphingobacterium sp. SYP-B4668]|uniref:dephospho-CoA kinase n=1 Tax=Sphingobacterium sp. SYP-B4668 TaxID=2996035 RepID=UPI0022DD3ACC|nr:dephospho-CoA kinase [Sphingobacterium sp. SYP-B4668]